MQPIDHMRLRAHEYDPTATFEIVNNWDGPGSNPIFIGWSGSLPEPTRAQLAAVPLPTAGTRMQARLTAYMTRTDDDAILFRALVNVMADQLGISRTAARNAILAEAKTILDGI